MPNKKIFIPGEPFKFSWSRFAVYLDCSRCFYLDNIKGIVRPPSLPLSLNNAVDQLVKTEFDIYRIQQQVHPEVYQQGLRLVPYQDVHLVNWRDPRVGIEADYAGYSFFGAIDDIWTDQQGDLYIVDYKTTVKPNPLEPYQIWDRGYYQKYRQQLDFYQWLFLKNGYQVSDTGYFVFANGDPTFPQFNNQLNFQMKIMIHEGNTKWIEPKIDEMILCLSGNQIPPVNHHCKYCTFAEKRKEW